MTPELICLENDGACGETVTLVGPRFRQLVAGILMAGKSLRFTAYGASMLPTLRSGDMLTLFPFRMQRLRRGMIVAVVCDQGTGRIVVHRIVRLTANTVETRGDSHQRIDGVFPLSSVLGILSRVERAGTDITFQCALWAIVPHCLRRHSPALMSVSIRVIRRLHRILVDRKR